MSKNDNIDRVWDIIEKVGVCMLTTQFGDGLRARPLEARPDRDAGLIFFVTDIHSAKEEEIEAKPDVGLVFIDSNDKAYLSITGRACIMRDADKTKAAWRKTDEVWWPGGPDRSQRMLVADRALLRNYGMDRQARRYCLRVRQGEVDRKGAEPRREPQGDGQDVARAERFCAHEISRGHSEWKPCLPHAALRFRPR